MSTRAAFAFVALLLLGCRDADIDHLVVVEIPASVASISAGTLYVSLFRYDPLLMDSPATRVDRAVLEFRHEAGQPTIARARLEGRGTSGERFYLAVNGCTATEDGARAVLWDGLAVEMPSYVRMRAREAPFPPCQAVEGE